MTEYRENVAKWSGKQFELRAQNPIVTTDGSGDGAHSKRWTNKHGKL